jgi:hypothetical protein
VLDSVGNDTTGLEPHELECNNYINSQLIARSKTLESAMIDFEACDF